MASRQAIFQFLAVFFIAAAVSSFTLVKSEDSSKSEEHSGKDVSTSDDASTQEDSKEKRSQEEIMFGNQQNKPNGLVDDLMGMSDNAEEDDSSAAFTPEKTADTQDEQQSWKDEMKDSKDDKRSPAAEEQPNDMMMGSGAENWIQVAPRIGRSPMQYSQAIKAIPSEEFSSNLYDQEDLYRRKRNLRTHHAVPLQKRSLRSSLGQMIQKTGIRMPRRSMRLKRQVDMEDLLNLFGNERFYDDEQQVTPHIFGGRSQTVAKRHVPGRFTGYPETPAPEFRYPDVFQHRDNGVLIDNDNMEDNNDVLEGEGVDDIDNLMLLPPKARYSNFWPYKSHDEEKEAIQSWLSRHTVPTPFRVQRRSAPYFYPIDYRYIPGYKKRSSFRNRNRDLNLFSNDDEAETDFGKWGHVVQVPEAYASPEDVARLYGLANLMAEEDEPEAKMRRST